MEKNYEIILWKDVEERFSPSFEMPFESFGDNLDEIRLFQGDVLLKGDFSIDYDNQYNMVVDGNLEIERDLYMSCFEGMGNFILVTGNLKARNIILGGFPSLTVKGEIQVENEILGRQGEDGGFLVVNGEVSAKVVIADTYFNMEFNSAVNAVIINTSYRDLEADYYGEDLEKILLLELIEDEECIDTDKVVEYLLSGKNILKK
ncbi:MAG: hypothetical protein JW891_01415 [Candidatus Lokiarchaeota archaeon]|nr:hypothetical protein [Candidatus Lokiarchaeota archaeon]